MHVAVSEFARNVAGMEGANSTEMDLETPFPVIDLLPEQKEIADMGGTMRLGADPVKLHPSTLIRELYNEPVVYERHRHRYEVNNHLRRRLESAGLVWSGTSPDERLVEAIELDRDVHPFYVASQYHPEFKSRPDRPAPLFREFVGAALARAVRVEGVVLREAPVDPVSGRETRVDGVVGRKARVDGASEREAPVDRAARDEVSISQATAP
jgi:CTP synthase